MRARLLRTWSKSRRSSSLSLLPFGILIRLRPLILCASSLRRILPRSSRTSWRSFISDSTLQPESDLESKPSHARRAQPYCGVCFFPLNITEPKCHSTAISCYISWAHGNVHAHCNFHHPVVITILHALLAIFMRVSLGRYCSSLSLEIPEPFPLLCRRN